MNSAQQTKNRNSIFAIILAGLHILLGIGGIGGGAVLLADTSGQLMGVPPELLNGLPIHSYLLPGLVLITFLGIIPIFVAYLVIKQPAIKIFAAINPVKRWHYSRSLSLFIGVFLIGWTTGEIILWDFNFLSNLYFVWGVATTLLSLILKTRQRR